MPEFPQPEPIYPEGTTGLPNTPFQAPNEEQVNYMLEHFTPEQNMILQEWWNYAYGRHSNFLNRVMQTPEDILEHARIHTEQAEKTVVKEEQYADKWLTWRAECTKRKEWIATKKAEVQKRTQERAEYLRSMKLAELEWDAYVDAAKKELTIAKNTPVPPVPKK